MRDFDYSNLKNRKFDSEIINYIGLIHEFKGRQQLYFEQRRDELDTLVEIVKIQSTESSNAIEGIVTTKARFKSLMNEKTSPKNRDEEEIKGYRYVLGMIHDNYEYIPVKKNYILQLHKMLYEFSDVRFGGQFKDSSNEIDKIYQDGTREKIFTPLEPFETPDAIEIICDEYDKAIHKYNIDPLIAIPVFIHDFLCIHPFNDGNGRMSRLLTALLLYQSGFIVGKYISLEKKIEITKDEYYLSLQEASKDWHVEKNDDTVFIKYILGTIIAAYRDFEDRVNLIGTKMSSMDYVKKAIQTKMGKFTKSDIIELCPNISRASIENCLKELYVNGEIGRQGKGRATFYCRLDK